MKILKNIIFLTILLSLLNTKKRRKNRIHLSNRKLKFEPMVLAKQAFDKLKLAYGDIKRWGVNKGKAISYAIRYDHPQRLPVKKIKFLTKLINKEKRNIYSSKRKLLIKYAGVLDIINSLKMALHRTSEEFNNKLEKINEVVIMGKEAEIKQDQIDEHKRDEVIKEERELEKEAENEVAEEMLLNKSIEKDEAYIEEENNFENDLDDNKKKNNEVV